VWGIADSYGVELRYPRRHGQAATQRGKKGLSNQHWIAGGKLCVLVNQWGRVVAWADATANVHDSAFHPLIARFDGQTVVLTDGNFHRKAGDRAAAHPRRDGALAAHARLPRQAGRAPPVGRLSGAPRLRTRPVQPVS
jgi:hypothetical protein